MKYQFISALALISAASAELVKLDDSNYAEMTEGKLVFVKFYAPW